MMKKEYYPKVLKVEEGNKRESTEKLIQSFKTLSDVYLTIREAVKLSLPDIYDEGKKESLTEDVLADEDITALTIDLQKAVGRLVMASLWGDISFELKDN